MTTEEIVENIDPEAVEAEIAAIQQQEDQARAKVFEVKLKMQEIQREYEKLSAELKENSAVVTEARSKSNQLELQLSRARRLEKVRDEQKKLQKEFDEASARLDELTAEAIWRTGTPSGYIAKDYQINGAKRLAVAKRGILGDRRGLGKSITGLAWADMVEAKRILVIAPNDVVDQFEDEVREWAPDRKIFHLKGMPKAQRDFIYPLMHTLPEYIAFINYEAWRKDKTIVDELIKAGLDTVIMDEAHRAKSANKITARGVFQVVYRPNHCPKCGNTANFKGAWFDKTKKNISGGADGMLVDYYPDGRHFCPIDGTELVSTVQNVLAMTGTPILNKPQELFSLLHVVNFRMFKNEKEFLDDYCVNYAPNRWKFRHGGLDRLMKFMSGFFIQRSRDDVGGDVPPPSITVHRLDKDRIKYSKQYRAEKMIKETAQLLLEDGTRKDIFFMLELILRQRQAMTWPAGIVIRDPETKEILCNFDVEESQKLDAAMDLIDELMEEGERVIIFSQFKAPLYEMHERALKNGYRSVMATGDQTQVHKNAVREDFDLKTAPEKPRYQLAFATYKAFGTGINLNAARHMILLDDEWNPGGEDQAIGRIDRMNSTDQAQVHIFRVNDSIDDFMEGLLDEKRNITEDFDTAHNTREMLMKYLLEG